MQVAKAAGRKAPGVEQFGHQHAHLAIRRDVAHQANLLGRAGKLLVGVVALARAQKHAHSGEAAVAVFFSLVCGMK